jgi:FKBP12-rapamycin complex-associated protein
MFLVKGHEDLRQDERVMQLFGLINTFFNAEYITSKNHLSIKRFSVIPLSPYCGLLGWVPHSDTFHNLVYEYREARKIVPDIEFRLMLQMVPDYDKLNLTVMQKLEIFKYSIESTNGTVSEKLIKNCSFLVGFGSYFVVKIQQF